MNKNKLTILITSIIFVGLLVTGATFAWFLWFSDNSEKTNVIFKVDNGAEQLKVILDADSTTFTDMYPTSDCSKNGAKMATVSIFYKNTSIASAFVDATLTLNRVIAGTTGNPDRSYIHYALSTNPKTTCTSGIFAQGTLSGKNNGDVIYNGDLTVGKISKNTTLTSKTIYLYVWIDEEYEYYNTGNSVVNDPMQNMTVEVVWSGTINNSKPDVTTGVFTFTDTPIVLNEALPTGIDIYDNHKDAEIAGGDYGIFAKSTIENDVVTENYLGFVIPSLAEESHPELLSGTYAIRILVGEGSTNRPVFESNVAIMTQAFGEENCTMREDNNQYQCVYTGGDGFYGMSVWMNIWGSGAIWTGGNRHCQVSLSDSSIGCYTTA